MTMMTPLPQRVTHNGQIADLGRARKCYKCDECGQEIPATTQYYSITLGGAGLASIKFPDRVHVGCLLRRINADKEEVS